LRGAPEGCKTLDRQSRSSSNVGGASAADAARRAQRGAPEEIENAPQQ
jgi:hypothetical protein